MTALLKTEDKAAVVAKILSGIDPIAEFDYTDRNGKTTRRRVKLNDFKADSNGNYVWYNFAENGHGGGFRSFKAGRIRNLKLL